MLEAVGLSINKGLMKTKSLLVAGLLVLLTIGRSNASDATTNVITIAGVSGLTNSAIANIAKNSKQGYFDFDRKIVLEATPIKPDYSLLIKIVDDAIPRDDALIQHRDTFKPLEYMGGTMDAIEEYGRTRTQLKYRFRTGREDALETGIESLDQSLNGVYIVTVGYSHSF